MTGRFHNHRKTLRPETCPGGRPWLIGKPDGGPREARVRRAWLAVALCAFAASVAWADGPGPASPNISLEIHNHASNGSDGYTNTTASNGAVYSYRYSGGEGNGGDVVFRTRGRVTVNIHVANDSGYSIEDVEFHDDANQQLSWLGKHGGASSAVIQDKNDAVQTARYKITVTDEASDVSVPCDPIIANRT